MIFHNLQSLGLHRMTFLIVGLFFCFCIYFFCFFIGFLFNKSILCFNCFCTSVLPRAMGKMMVGWWTTSSSSGLKEMVEGKEKEKPQIFTFFLNRGNTFILLGTSALRGLGLWESHDRWGWGVCSRYKWGGSRAALCDGLSFTQSSSVGASGMSVCDNQPLPSYQAH